MVQIKDCVDTRVVADNEPSPPASSQSSRREMLDGGKAISTPVGESKVITNRDGDSLVAGLAGSTGSIFLPLTMPGDGAI